MLELLADIIKTSDNIVAFTGAGVSTESGIPDFRSDGGIYENIRGKYGFAPEYLLSHSFFMEHPGIFYDYYRKHMVYREALPNRCHKALAAFEAAGRLKAVVTQNIDGLQQAAGSSKVIELHGTIHKNTCLSCGRHFDLEYIMDAVRDVPRCEACGGMVKPDVVLYQEQLDAEVLRKAVQSIASADVLMVMGTSLAVYPAAGLIDYYRGHNLVLVNKSPTAYDSRARIVINDSVGKIMGILADSLFRG